MTIDSLKEVVTAAASREPLSARVCVGVATRGRPDNVAEVVRRLRRQTLAPTEIVIVYAEPSDIAGLEAGVDIELVIGAAGLTRQRNVVLDRICAGANYIVFFDDDFLPDESWLEQVVAHFEADPTIACVTGNVIADGIKGAGLTIAEGETALQSLDRRTLDWIIDDFSPYGCNMAFRASAIEGLRFDERLVLYGWLEDRDFGARVAASGGRLVKIGAAVGVHLGAKRGRVSGKRLGYSQIVNPTYMRAKRTITLRTAVTTALCNVSANLAKAPWPEIYVDRRGRLLGNMLAVFDLLRGVCEPERAERL